MKRGLFNEWRAMMRDPATPLKGGSIGESCGNWEQSYLTCGCALTALYACTLEVKITDLRASRIVSDAYRGAENVLGHTTMLEAQYLFDNNANIYGVDEARIRFVLWMDLNEAKLVD